MGNAVSLVRDRSGLFELIGHTYESVLDETLWPAMAPRIGETFGALSGQDLLSQKSEFLSLNDQDSAKSIESYETYYELRDVWLSRASKMGMGHAWTRKVSDG